ncbi:hypothetical protein K492DRAFT_187697 [Lichtheimia hyalospora FSU 10163]|nr:hypothetical protein K492DRAFT_187697 [Lichtheimia hyalospora FSU 10163]
MDEFPALRSSTTAPGAPTTPFGNDLSAVNSLASKDAVGGEPWDYTSARESMSNSKQYGAPGIRNDMLGSSQWSRGSNAGESTPTQSRKSVGSSLVREQDGKTSSTTPGSGASSGSNSDVKSGDSYGLLGLLGVIRMTDPDRSMLALGSDLTTLGLDLNTAETVHATPPAHQRMRTFSDEILFYVFYSMPKDVAQEAAAQELYARNWRYHKELGMWLTKETDENGRPVQGWRRTTPNPVDRGVYIIFDPTSWSKVKREWTLPWDALEERQAQPQQQTPSSGSSSQPRPQQQQQPGMSMSSTPTGISPGLASRGVMI